MGANSQSAAQIKLYLSPRPGTTCSASQTPGPVRRRLHNSCACTRTKHTHKLEKRENGRFYRSKLSFAYVLCCLPRLFFGRRSSLSRKFNLSAPVLRESTGINQPLMMLFSALKKSVRLCQGGDWDILTSWSRHKPSVSCFFTGRSIAARLEFLSRSAYFPEFKRRPGETSEAREHARQPRGVLT